MTGRTVSIVGGGWSMKGIDHSKIPGEVIAVNDSAFLLERKPNYIVSMDRLWVEHRWSNDPANKGGLVGLMLPTFLRRNVLKNVPWQDRPWGWLHAFDCSIQEPLMSLDPLVLNGPNSGHCAMNLAFTMKPKTLFLFGFDMCRNEKGEAYWFPPYEWVNNKRAGGVTQSQKAQGATGARRYTEWAGFMRQAAEQFKDLDCKVFNVSPMSAIQCFEKVSPREMGICK